MNTGASSEEKSFSIRVVIPSGPAALWILSPASSFCTPLTSTSIFGMDVCGGDVSSLMVVGSSVELNTDENWSFKMLALVVGSEYVKPSLAFNGATPVLSVLLLVMKLQNFLGLD